MASDHSTPKSCMVNSPSIAKGTKRPRVARGSDSSIDNELSYLDLDTGSISISKAKQVDRSDDFDSLLAKIKLFEQGISKLDKLDKLDQIETNVGRMVAKMAEFESRLVNNEKVTTELQASVQFVSSQYDDIKASADTEKSKLKACVSDIDQVKAENNELRATLAELRGINESMKEELLDLRCRSMRDNLIFTNIPENVQHVDGRHFENTEQELNAFLLNKLGLNDVKFERVHRIASKDKNRRDRGPRPIVAKFTFFKQREEVRKSGYKLKNTSFGIHEQFPDEVEETRRNLYPILRQARRENKKAVLVRDRLYVNGELVRPEATRGRTEATGRH